MFHKEVALVRAFKDGEDWAFSKVFKRYRKLILKFVSQKVRDEEAAEEITQEVFLKAYRFRESFRPDYAFSTWLWGIARNTMVDRIRKDRRDPMSERTDGYADTEVAECETLPCGQPNAEHILLRRGDRKHLGKFLKLLTGPQKRVLWLRIMHRLSYAEIAKRLGLSLSAVKCLAYRARVSLSEGGLELAAALN